MFFYWVLSSCRPKSQCTRWKVLTDSRLSIDKTLSIAVKTTSRLKVLERLIRLADGTNTLVVLESSYGSNGQSIFISAACRARSF